MRRIDRRTLLLGAAGALAAAGIGIGRRAAAQEVAACFVASRQEPDGRHAVAVFDAEAGDRLVLPLPGRGHDVAVSPRTGNFVVFARRPGRFALAVADGRPAALIEPPAGRHFNGHGCFSPSGDLLYASENDFQAQRGVIGVYESRRWQRLGELLTHGVGPHEILLLPDGKTLAVANGGIATDPSVADGRTPVDPHVVSDLVHIDRRTGERRGQWRLPDALADLSIRHLALDRLGNLWFGAQWEGAADAAPPLLGRLSAAGGLQTVATAAIDGNLANYVGSVATDRSGTLLAASSPRSGQVAVLDAAQARLLAVVPFADVCGLAADDAARQFIASSGSGALQALAADGDRIAAEPLRTALPRWDNHLRRLNWA